MTAPLVAPNPPPLDESLYSLDEDELAFFKSETGINDEGELKKHILTVQARAYEVFPYPCIGLFLFTKLGILRSPFYERALQIAKEHKDPILLDVGCNCDRVLTSISSSMSRCVIIYASNSRVLETVDFGYDGIASINQHLLYPFVLIISLIHRDVAGSCPCSHSSSIDNFCSISCGLPLHGAEADAQMKSQDRPLEAGRRLASLLSPDPGSIIFGGHGGLPVKGNRTHHLLGSERTMFCHSPESWRDFWDGQVFAKGTVRVEAELQEHILAAPERIGYFMVWCVTRV
ncbi:hypothetical protein M378DRAFT_73824 [Amanita muscaria Koide BX008]|uniref:Uncharacterized protein n=1 Tax=Amanita muscaria (strain Koide BX008) TaxID=946122 RepID=A0A0C2WZG9_AMAMK|nr:hypothetical protein M378DRAFT_73824 [Amanita muscaria Koide BX008]